MRPPPGRRENYSYFLSHTTRWSDNDIYGHLNNVVHYLFYDSTVNQWLISNGLLKPQTSAAIGLVAETGCRYHAEMAYPQAITAGLRVAKLGSSSVRYELGLFADESDTAAAEGFLVHVYVNAQTHKPCPIPELTRAALQSLLYP